MDKEYYGHYRLTEDEHWWFRGRRRIVAEALNGLNLPPETSILEVGCGTGGNLAMLSRFGRLSALELDDDARALASGRGIVEVCSGRLPDRIPFDQDFDLIVALDVIEHIEDDLAALGSLVAKLAPGGRLVVTVPAFMFLWSEHDEINHHFRRYRRSELSRRLAQAGLAVHHLTYFNTILLPLVVADRMLQRLRPAPPPHRAGRGDLRLPGPTLNRTLESLFAAERRLVSSRTLPFGVSILAVAGRADEARGSQEPGQSGVATAQPEWSRPLSTAPGGKRTS